MKQVSLQDSPEQKRTRAVKKQPSTNPLEIDIFKKVPGVEYFDPREWSSFPYSVGKGGNKL